MASCHGFVNAKNLHDVCGCHVYPRSLYVTRLRYAIRWRVYTRYVYVTFSWRLRDMFTLPAVYAMCLRETQAYLILLSRLHYKQTTSGSATTQTGRSTGRVEPSSFRKTSTPNSAPTSSTPSADWIRTVWRLSNGTTTTIRSTARRECRFLWDREHIQPLTLFVELWGTVICALAAHVGHGMYAI